MLINICDNLDDACLDVSSLNFRARTRVGTKRKPDAALV